MLERVSDTGIVSEYDLSTVWSTIGQEEQQPRQSWGRLVMDFSRTNPNNSKQQQTRSFTRRGLEKRLNKLHAALTQEKEKGAKGNSKRIEWLKELIREFDAAEARLDVVAIYRKRGIQAGPITPSR